jgi:hypothetical protein
LQPSQEAFSTATEYTPMISVQTVEARPWCKSAWPFQIRCAQPLPACSVSIPELRKRPCRRVVRCPVKRFLAARRFATPDDARPVITLAKNPLLIISARQIGLRIRNGSTPVHPKGRTRPKPSSASMTPTASFDAFLKLRVLDCVRDCCPCFTVVEENACAALP